MLPQPPPRLPRGLRQLLLLAALMAGAMGGYVCLLRAPAERVWATRTFLDEDVPFWPSWTWIYLLPYVLAPLLAVSLAQGAFVTLCRRALVVIGLGFLAFALWPSEVVRPDASALDDGLTAQLYRAMVAFDDPPRNAAPSLHVGLAVLFGAALGSRGRAGAAAGLAFAVLVALSTLFTGQHHVLDVLAGGGLAAAVLLAVPGAREQVPPAREPGPSGRPAAAR